MPDQSKLIPCPRCKGRGSIVVSSPYLIGTPMSHSNYESVCPACSGRCLIERDADAKAEVQP